MESGVSPSLGRMTTHLHAPDDYSQVETLGARGWPLSCKNDPRREIPDFGPSDKYVSSCFLSSFSSPPGRMPTMGFCTIVRRSITCGFDVTIDPRGMRQYFYAIVVSG
ncbi:hypothetical protein C4D60_Mb05t08650 [Musa balbisiana]|uniref:Uncharacterized protein n=1 Tax=Musa balbisiana TaxID=52838 RepID=A0A4S8JUP8_MUSBA|nr:hypothetical protein C4D60_Mb05t08650 [Musa balbisiana]